MTVDPLDLSAGAVGGWLQLPSAPVAELMGSVGFAFLCIDQQHGMIGPDAMIPMLQGLAAAGTPAVVRVPSNDHTEIGRALDHGAAAVIVPLVNSAEQARAAVDAFHYPPRGSRSFGPTRSSWYRDLPAPLCIVMIETMAAVAALPEILAVEGVDAIFVGPSDLSLSAGLPLTAQDGDPAFDALLQPILDAARDRGMPAGIFCMSAAHARRFRQMGATYVALFSEAGMLRAAAGKHLAAAREDG
ncbi:HpcH/HpaI aldolase family protein [Pseudonocardia sp. GCM10023141]|uniref:HpcH/HpaI aldolase family protein n=1 Tax=Pseudonocardia sp. GCM10023141 TaxID=3252653 RepID=UPI00361BB159